MKKFTQLATVGLVGALMFKPAIAGEKPFVTVNGSIVSQATADMYLAQGKANGMPVSPEMQNRLREELIRRELMFQAARQAGFDKKPEVVSQVNVATRIMLAQLDATKQTVITRAYLEDYLKAHPVNDAQLKVAYDAARAKGGDTEYKARHILVKDEIQARDIIVKLNNGSKFEEMAQQSIDAGSKINGGDLGWSSPAKFVKSFSDALTSLKKGKYSAMPVKTDFGYHVIKLDDTRPLKVPTFDEMKPILRKDAESMAIEKIITELREKAKIQ